MVTIIDQFANLNIGYQTVTIGEVFISIIIIIAAIIIGRFISNKVKRQLHDVVSANNRELIVKSIYFAIIFAGLLIALPYLDLDLSGLLLAGGIFGIIIGFAGQNVFSNFISGIILIFERPIKIGDNIGIEDTLGTVEDIRILSTIIKTYDGIYTRIPNQTLFTANITNYVTNVARRFEYKIGIRYSDDAEKAMSVMWEIIKNHPFALKYPEPSIFVEDLGDNAVIISVRIWSPSLVWWDVRTELLWKIKKTIEENGIQIPFPQRTVWFPEGMKNDVIIKEKVKV